MSTIDYANLPTRAKAAKANVEEGAKAKPVTPGEYNAIFAKGELTTSKKGNEMFILKFKVAENALPEEMRGRTLSLVYVTATDWKMDQFLDVMVDAGVNMESIATMKDGGWSMVFTTLLIMKFKVLIKVVEDPGNEKFPTKNKIIGVDPVPGGICVLNMIKASNVANADILPAPSNADVAPTTTEKEVSAQLDGALGVLPTPEVAAKTGDLNLNTVLLEGESDEEVPWELG